MRPPGRGVQLAADLGAKKVLGHGEVSSWYWSLQPGTRM